MNAGHKKHIFPQVPHPRPANKAPLITNQYGAKLPPYPIQVILQGPHVLKTQVYKHNADQHPCLSLASNG